MLWTLALCVTALAEPDRSYETRNLLLYVDAPISDRATARAAVKAELAPYKIRRVVLLDEDGSRQSVRIAQLDLAQSLAVIIAAAFKTRGAEVVLIVEGGDQRLYPVSVWWEEDMVVAAGPPIGDLIGEVRTPDSLVEDYGIPALISGRDRDWDRRSAALLGQALDLLSEPELAMLADVPFMRVASASVDTQQLVGMQEGERLYAAFLVDGEGPRIEVYDVALSPSSRFVGDPWDPKPDALRTLLHEIAHAMAFSDYRAIATHIVTLIGQHDALRDQTGPHIDEMNALVERYNDRPTKANLRGIRAMEAELADYRTQARALEDEIATAKGRLDEKPTTAAALAFEAVLAGQPAPTWYASRTIEEGFAESYSLFRADPAALKRLLPDVYGWFADGTYLPLLNQPTSP